MTTEPISGTCLLRPRRCAVPPGRHAGNPGVAGGYHCVDRSAGPPATHCSRQMFAVADGVSRVEPPVMWGSTDSTQTHPAAPMPAFSRDLILKSPAYRPESDRRPATADSFVRTTGERHGDASPTKDRQGAGASHGMNPPRDLVVVVTGLAKPVRSEPARKAMPRRRPDRGDRRGRLQGAGRCAQVLRRPQPPRASRPPCQPRWPGRLTIAAAVRTDADRTVSLATCHSSSGAVASLAATVRSPR